MAELLEKFYVAQSRVMFLRKMHRIKNENERPIFYLDESLIYRNHSPNFNWHHSTMGSSFKVPTGKGGRTLHAGSKKTRFLNGSKFFLCTVQLNLLHR